MLTRFALERLLYRLSVSGHRNQFVLKGAMLFVTWVADPFRPTRDLDLLGYGDNDVEAIAGTFRSICDTQVPDDGVTFDIRGLHAASIRGEAEYGGVKLIPVTVHPIRHDMRTKAAFQKEISALSPGSAERH